MKQLASAASVYVRNKGVTHMSEGGRGRLLSGLRVEKII